MFIDYFLRFLVVYIIIAIGFAGSFLIVYTGSFEGFRSWGWSMYYPKKGFIDYLALK